MRLFTVIAALLVLSGCRGPRAVEPEPGAAKPRAWVEVHNNFALPVEISISGGGTVYRLGTVHPGMTSRYVIPGTFGNGNTVEFRAYAGTNVAPLYRSAELLIQPGTIVDFDVASVLFNSTAVIRP